MVLLCFALIFFALHMAHIMSSLSVSFKISCPFLLFQISIFAEKNEKSFPLPLPPPLSLFFSDSFQILFAIGLGRQKNQTLLYNNVNYNSFVSKNVLGIQTLLEISKDKT